MHRRTYYIYGITTSIQNIFVVVDMYLNKRKIILTMCGIDSFDTTDVHLQINWR